MELGDFGTLVQAAATVGALGLSGWAAWSARGARSEAREASERAERGVQAQERMAAAVESFSQRTDDDQVPVPLALERAGSETYRLRNVSSEAITVHLEDDRWLVSTGGDVGTIGPLQSVALQLGLSMADLPPGELVLDVEGRGPITLPLP